MKKVVSLLLVLLLSLGMVTVATANDRIIKGNESDRYSDIDDGAVAIQWGNKVWIPIPHGPFFGYLSRTDGLATPANAKGYIVADGARFRAPSFTFRAQQNSAMVDSSALELLKLTDKDADYGDKDTSILTLRITFHEKFRNTNLDGVEFKYTISFKNNTTGIDGNFRIGNAYIIMDSADLNVLNTEKGYVIKAEKYNSKIEVEIGGEVILNTRLFNGRRYWAWAETDWWEKVDDDMKAKYKDIQEVINIDWLGYNDATTTVHLSGFAGDNYWVYSADEDGNLTYLGRSNNKDLPLVAKYYLASRELNIDSDIEPDDDDDDEYDDVPEINPITGGDDVYPSNVNDNPGTGK